MSWPKDMIQVEMDRIELGDRVLLRLRSLPGDARWFAGLFR